MTDKSRLLWVDLTTKQDPETGCDLAGVCSERMRKECIAAQDCHVRHGLSDICDRYRHSEAGAVAEAVLKVNPHLLCFDYDYPNGNRLKILQAIKHRFPSIPILMFTVYHSEALAVWAFRTGVRDFIVKPIKGQDLVRRVAALLGLASEERKSRRCNLMPPEPVPVETRFTDLDASQKTTYPALSYIEAHGHEAITFNDGARLCGMRRFEFSRTFKKEHGVGFQEYLLRRRIDKAEELLNNPRALVSDVAFTVGCNDLSYFSRMFRRYKGLAPSAYRQALLPRQALGEKDAIHYRICL